MVRSSTEKLVTALLREAGITETVTVLEPIATQGITNRLYHVTLASGRRLVAREYHWPWQQAEYDRLSKERYLHGLLRDQGVPVPAILAAIDQDGRTGTLLEHLPGQLLGEVSADLPPAERDQAWRDCGAVLRRAHRIGFAPGTYGVIVGEQVRPFAAVDPEAWGIPGSTWGDFHAGMIRRNLTRLVERGHPLPLPPDAADAVLEAVVPALNRFTPSLLHNDAHAWNVLVRRTPDGWRCAGWLDWEYAWVGDPDWDLVRMDLFRQRPLGPTPAAFWEGYGHRPTGIPRLIYELHVHVWMVNQYLDGDRHLMPTYEAALQAVANLERALEALARAIAGEPETSATAERAS